MVVGSTSEVPRGGQIEVARVYSKRNRHRQGRMGRCHCYRVQCRRVYTHDTYTVAQHRLTDDVELQEAEARSRWRGLGSEAKVGLIRPKGLRRVPRSHWPASEKRFLRSAIFFVSDLPEQIHEAAERSNSAQRSRMCDAEQTSCRKCRTSRSKEQSGFQELGRWSVVSETGLVDGVLDGVGPGGIAHMYQNVSCSAMPCCPVLVLEPFRSESQSQLQLQWPVRRMRFEA